MTAPYRDDLAALEARYAALEAEVADRERARDEAARMLAEAKARARNEEIAADVRAGGPERRRQRYYMIGTMAAMLAVGIGAAYHLATRKPTREQRMEAALKKFEGFVDDACACKDKACTDDVQSRLMRWSEEMARTDDFTREPPSHEVVEKATKLGTRYADCLTKIVTRDAERFP
jgi:hypothetical protein